METYHNTSYRKENFLEQFTSLAGGVASAAMGSQILGQAGAAGSAIAGAGVAAGNFALTQAGNAVKNMSIIMVILGTIQFILRPVFGDAHPFIFVLSLVLFIMAGYALAEKVQVDRIAVFIPMLIFCIWYFYFKANYMPSFLIYFLTISAFVLILVDAVTKGQSVKPEMYGFLPVIFLFLDLGLIPFLVDNVGLPLTGLAQNLILFMPWWAFFGIMTFPIDPTDKESKINALMRLVHIFGVIYIVFVFLIPMIPTVGYDSDSLVPDAYTMASAQENYRKEMSGKENPMYSTLACLWAGHFEDLSVCVDERAELAEIEAFCYNEGFDEGTEEYNQCVEDEQREKEEWENSISGSVASDFDEHVDVEITKGGYFDDEIAISSDNWETLGYPVEVRIENPNEEEFSLEVSCNFVNKDKDEPSIVGVVEHSKLEDSILNVVDSDEYSFLCEPETPLNGTYNMEFELFLPEMQTQTYLKRAIVEKYDEDNPMRDANQYQLLSAFFIGDGKNGEAYYPEEFVVIVFEIGDKVLELDDSPLLASRVENVGDGSIVEILDYYIEVEDLDIQGDSTSCYSGGAGSVYIEEGNNEGDSFPLGSCYVDFGSDIENTVEDYDVSFQIFKGTITYSYSLESKFKVEVDLI